MANFLTVLRIFLILPIGIVLVITTPIAVMAGAVLFCCAALTDFLDGYIARRQGHISSFGTAMDPIADKMLTAAVLVLLVANDTVTGLHLIPVGMIILREIFISGMREAFAQILSGRDEQEGTQNFLAVSALAKWKTAIQFIALLALIVSSLSYGLLMAGLFLLWTAAALTLWTGVQYCIGIYRLVNNTTKSLPR